MTAEKLRCKLKELFGNQVIFNKEFDSYAESIKNIETNLVEWCTLLKEKKIPPIPASKLKDGVVFIKKIGLSNRCIVLKKVNDVFKEIHLADHAYYDKLRKKLGLKQDSWMY